MAMQSLDSIPSFTLESTMKEVQLRFPFSKELLHQKFHVGGCASCGFEPEETIGQVAKKHSKDAQSMLDVLNDGLDGMRSAEIEVSDFVKLRGLSTETLVLDVREAWENEICSIPGAILLTQDNMEKLFETALGLPHVVVYCHHGVRSLNAALFMREHGITSARSLKGGIDAYSLQADPSIQRY